MFKIIILTTILASLCLLGILLNITTPATIGPFGILAIFVFAYMLSLGVVTFFIFYFSKLLNKLSLVFIARKPLGELSFRHSYYYSTIFAAVPILFVGLQSVGAVGVYGVILILIFTAIGCLYISKRIE
ncbi:MAG: hypothetical protein WA087_02045 [Candidatus Saccharimonadales bacterium]